MRNDEGDDISVLAFSKKGDNLEEETKLYSLLNFCYILTNYPGSGSWHCK